LRPDFSAYAVVFASFRAITHTTTQSSAFLPIPGECNYAFLMSYRHIAGAFPPC